MGLFERKSERETELEQKIKKLRDAGFVRSADRLEHQLKGQSNREAGKDDKIKPMTGVEQMRAIKAHKAR